jgi:hypothetical protein
MYTQAITGGRYTLKTSNPDPWRRLAAKVIERAVFDMIQGQCPHKLSGARFLTETDIRRWADAWGLQLPWSKIDKAARQEVYSFLQEVNR